MRAYDFGIESMCGPEFYHLIRGSLFLMFSTNSECHIWNDGFPIKSVDHSNIMTRNHSSSQFQLTCSAEESCTEMSLYLVGFPKVNKVIHVEDNVYVVGNKG